MLKSKHGLSVREEAVTRLSSRFRKIMQKDCARQSVQTRDSEMKQKWTIADTRQDQVNDRKQHMKQKHDAVPIKIHGDQHPSIHKKTDPSWEKDKILQVGHRQDMICCLMKALSESQAMVGNLMANKGSVPDVQQRPVTSQQMAMPMEEEVM